MIKKIDSTIILIILTILALCISDAHSVPTLAEEIQYCKSIKNDPIFDAQAVSDKTAIISQLQLKEGIKKISRCAIIAHFIC
jgi:hypothetical protein